MCYKCLRQIAIVFVAIVVALFGCSKQAVQVTELSHFPISSLDGIITGTGVEFDNQISSDGNGALRIVTPESTLVRLFELRDVDVEDARLIYRARVRTENLEGQAYLELLCHFSGMGEFFSRDVQTPLTGTTDWTTEEVLFFLREGETPDIVKLNLVINGSGTVWIDDIHLSKASIG